MQDKSTRIVITGAAGSGGSYMLEHLLKSQPKNKYFAVVRGLSDHQKNTLEQLSANIVICDLNDYAQVTETFSQIKPDQIYHFASNADVRASFERPLEFLQNNIFCTAHVFESCRQLRLNPKIVLCSTSEVYGQVAANEVPISENNAIRPASPYAVSKTTQDLLADVYYKSYGLHVVKSRMFTYLNPRRRGLFATSFAFQIAEIEAGLRSHLTHGNLNSVRTLLDIRDVVSAYELVMAHGLPGEAYNIGGTAPITVGECLKILIRNASCEIKCEADPALLRPNDVTLQIPNTDKFTKLTGWKPLYDPEESLVYLLQHARESVQKEIRTHA